MLLTVVSQKDTLSSFRLAQEVSSWLTPNFALFYWNRERKAVVEKQEVTCIKFPYSCLEKQMTWLIFMFFILANAHLDY